MTDSTRTQTSNLRVTSQAAKPLVFITWPHRSSTPTKTDEHSHRAEKSTQHSRHLLNPLLTIVHLLEGICLSWCQFGPDTLPLILLHRPGQIFYKYLLYFLIFPSLEFKEQIWRSLDSPYILSKHTEVWRLIFSIFWQKWDFCFITFCCGNITCCSSFSSLLLL